MSDFIFTTAVLCNVLDIQHNDTARTRGTQRPAIQSCFNTGGTGIQKDHITSIIKGNAKYRNEDLTSINYDKIKTFISDNFIDESLIEYLYELFIDQPNGIDSATMLQQLLIKSIKHSKNEHQQMMRSIRDDERGKEAVEQLINRTFDINNLDKKDNNNGNNDNGNKDKNDFMQYFGWISEIEQNIDNIESVELSFIAGSNWLTSGNMLYDLFQNLNRKQIPMRILMNDEEIAKSLCRYTRNEDELNNYVTNGLNGFKKYSDKNDNIQIKKCSIPFGHTYYCFNMKNQSESKMRVSFYTFGCADMKLKLKEYFTQGNKYFELYQREFNFLWNISTSIE